MQEYIHTYELIISTLPPLRRQAFTRAVIVEIDVCLSCDIPKIKKYLII